MNFSRTLRAMQAEPTDIERVARRLRRELEERHNFERTPRAASRAGDTPSATMRHPAVADESRSTERSWWLVLESGGKPCQVRLQREVTIVGRDESCDVRIPASTVSKFHCRIEIRGDRLHVEDLQSRNGTFHNERRILETQVASGDQLAVGPVNFRVFAINKPVNVSRDASVARNDETLVAWPSAS